MRLTTYQHITNLLEPLWHAFRIIASIVLVLAVFYSNAQADSISDAIADANNVYSSQTNSHFGSTNAMQSNAYGPIFSSNRPMTSVSGTHGFSAQLLCPSSSSLVAITISPLTSGDITVEVDQDLYLEGILSYQYLLPQIVSGVCVNGFISCSPGSMTGCSYYTWGLQAGSSGPRYINGAFRNPEMQIVPQPATLDSLTNCSCINNYCGNNLALMQSGQILTSLGAGITNTLHAAYPTESISSDVRLNNLTISYFGQTSGNCGSANQGTGPLNPAQFFNPQNDTALVAAGSSDSSSELTMPNSNYTLIMNDPYMQNQGFMLQSCSVSNNWFYNELASDPTYTIQPWLDIKADCYNTQGCTGGHNNGTYYDCVWTINADTNNDGAYDTVDTAADTAGYVVYGAVDPSQVTTGNGTYLNGTISGYVTDVIVPAEQLKYGLGPCLATGDCQMVPGSQTFSVYSKSDFALATGCANIPIPDFVSYEVKWQKKSPPKCDTAAGYQYYQPNNKCYIETLANNTSDMCTNYETNPACAIKNETLYGAHDTIGVQTIMNFNLTRMNLIASTMTITGYFASSDVTEPWWKKSITYACTSSTASWDFSDMRARMGTIIPSIQDNGSNITYDDKTKNTSGAWTNYAGERIDINTNSGSGSCQMACKTSMPAVNNQVTQSGATNNFQNSTASTTYLYRACDSNNHCPIGPGETMVMDCSCMNTFLQATSAAATAIQATQDMICSSGSPTTVQP